MYLRNTVNRRCGILTVIYDNDLCGPANDVPAHLRLSIIIATKRWGELEGIIALKISAVVSTLET